MAAGTSGDRAEVRTPESWAAALLESDRRYFEAGAEIVAVPGAAIALLRGAESLASGCVVQRIDSARLEASSHAAVESWLGDLESRLRSIGAARARLYVERTGATLAATLSRRGYRRRVEHGFVRESGGAGESDLELEPADDDAGWSRRLDLVRRAGAVPDGLAADPGLWIEMERRRTRAGYMRPFLVRRGDGVVAIAGAAPCGPLLRLKNVVVDPGHRRRGVATALAVRFARLAAEEGFSAAGCFAIEGDPGMGIYGPAGYRAVTSQDEWVRELGRAS